MKHNGIERRTLKGKRCEEPIIREMPIEEPFLRVIEFTEAEIRAIDADMYIKDIVSGIEGAIEAIVDKDLPAGYHSLVPALKESLTILKPAMEGFWL